MSNPHGLVVGHIYTPANDSVDGYDIWQGNKYGYSKKLATIHKIGSGGTTEEIATMLCRALDAHYGTQAHGES